MKLNKNKLDEFIRTTRAYWKHGGEAYLALKFVKKEELEKQIMNDNTVRNSQAISVIVYIVSGLARYTHYDKSKTYQDVYNALEAFGFTIVGLE